MNIFSIRKIIRFCKFYGIVALIIVPVYLFISYIFNFVYFIILGIKMKQIPLTTADYILSINSLFYLLISMVLSFGLLFYEPSCIKRIKNKNRSKTKEEISKSINIFLLITKLLFIFSTCLCIAIFIIFGFLKTPTFILVFPFAFLCILLSEKYNNYIFICFFFISLVLLITNEARKMSVMDYKSTQIVCIDKKDYLNVRTLERGFLVKDSTSNKILFITNEHDIIKFDIPKRLLEL